MRPKHSSILVLEDEPSVLSLITAVLHAGGCRDLATCTSLAEARELWRKNAGRFDLVLTDFTLPDGSVPSLLIDMLKEKPDLQVVLMSGFPVEALGLPSELEEKIHTFAKPFRPVELLAFLQQLPVAVPA